MKEIVLEEQDARDLMTCLSAINVSTSLLYHTEGEENLSLEEAEEFYKGVFSVGVEAKASLIELKHHLMKSIISPIIFILRMVRFLLNLSKRRDYGNNRYIKIFRTILKN